MKVYLEKGHGMSASLRVDPCKIQHEIVGDHPGVPQELKTHALVIMGYADETVTIQGDLAELMQVVVLMAETLQSAWREEGND